jgi:hypothetical protein
VDSIVFPALPTYLFAPTLAGVLSLAVTVLLPLLAAVLMRSTWSAFKKGLVLLAMSGIKAFLEAWIGAGDHFDFGRCAYATLVNFGIAVVFYMGILKGTDIQQAAINSGVKPKP